MPKREEELERERALVELAQRDPTQFGVLYELYVDKIYHFVLARVRHSEVAEDVVAQTFFKALESLHQFTWKGFPFSAWLYKIASNEVLQYFRSKKRDPDVALDDVQFFLSDGETPADSAEQGDLREQVLVLIRQLPQAQQEVLVLRFVEELSNKEIGAIIGKKEGAVRQLLFRAMNGLRKLAKDSPLSDKLFAQV